MTLYVLIKLPTRYAITEYPITNTLHLAASKYFERNEKSWVKFSFNYWFKNHQECFIDMKARAKIEISRTCQAFGGIHFPLEMMYGIIKLWWSIIQEIIVILDDNNK